VNARFERYRVGLRKWLPFLPLFIFLMVLSSSFSSAAETVQPTITVKVNPDTVLVGDRMHYTIRVRHSEQEVASLEGFDRSGTSAEQPFELISRKHVATTPFSGAAEDLFAFEFGVFGAGHQSIPSFTVVIRDTKGKIAQKINYRPATTLFVRALTDSSMRELRPIKPPLKPSIPSVLIMGLFFGAFGIAGMVLLLLFLLKRTVRNSAERIDSGQVAQRKLKKLGSSLSAGMPPHECYEELSNIMRTFLENHYRISALEAVTQEIERDLKKLGVAGFESIMNLLKQADLVKFADSRPDAEESRQSLNKASEVIRSARSSKAEG